MSSPGVYLLLIAAQIVPDPQAVEGIDEVETVLHNVDGGIGR